MIGEDFFGKFEVVFFPCSDGDFLGGGVVEESGESRNKDDEGDGGDGFCKRSRV